MIDFKLGKRPARVDPRTLRLASYVDRALLPTFPDHIDPPSVPDWGMFANDRLGDCTCAAAAHMIESWRAVAHDTTDTPPTDSDVIAAYNAVNGGQDNGAQCLDVLNLWRQQGIAGNKILAFGALLPGDREHAKLACWLFGGLYLGLQVPVAWQQPGPWDVGQGDTFTPGSWGGHAVDVVGYDAAGVTVVTWGQLQQITWAGMATYCDEMYGVLDSGWSLPGFDLAALQADLAALG